MTNGYSDSIISFIFPSNHFKNKTVAMLGTSNSLSEPNYFIPNYFICSAV